jgi:hypothetical protein
MTNPNMEGLPPEMQARIAQIIAGAKQQAEVQAPVAPPTPPAPPAPPVRQPNLMDHVIMLRQEVDQMRQQLDAVGQVTDAVGQAVGQMYAMFQSQTEPTSASAAFQAQAPQQTLNEDY